MREQRIKLTRSVKRVEIIAAADVHITDPDLRHRVASASAAAEIRPEVRLAGQINLLEVRTFAAQQIFCHVAVAAVASGIDLDF